MKVFRKHKGLVAVLDRANVDTDKIIPKQFLKKVDRSGFGIHLFHDWRYLDREGQTLNPDFILNQERYRGASILVSGDNFGCGSSREHAPWALADYGFRVIIAPSFADIFFNNCFKNSILPVELPRGQVERIMAWVIKTRGAQITADLTTQEILFEESYHFTINPFQKECLLNGWDDIDITLKEKEAIDAFERDYYRRYSFYLLPEMQRQFR